MSHTGPNPTAHQQSPKDLAPWGGVSQRRDAASFCIPEGVSFGGFIQTGQKTSDAAPIGVAALTSSNNQFALDLYAKLRKGRAEKTGGDLMASMGLSFDIPFATG